jgi:hypothetical protein
VTHALTKALLSPARRRLLEAHQRVNFGEIRGLRIHNGEPVFDPPPRLIYTIKLGGDNGPRPELEVNDFALKATVIELFWQLDRIGDGVIDRIEVRHGLPFLMTVSETGA